MSLYFENQTFSIKCGEATEPEQKVPQTGHHFRPEQQFPVPHWCGLIPDNHEKVVPVITTTVNHTFLETK